MLTFIRNAIQYTFEFGIKAGTKVGGICFIYWFLLFIESAPN